MGALVNTNEIDPARRVVVGLDELDLMARACGHDHLYKFTKNDLATWNDQMAKLTGVNYAGFAQA